MIPPHLIVCVIMGRYFTYMTGIKERLNRKIIREQTQERLPQSGLVQLYYYVVL